MSRSTRLVVEVGAVAYIDLSATVIWTFSTCSGSTPHEDRLA